jgi:hypothetical protein
MGKLTNLVMIAAATVLIVVGVAAQTGTISIGSRSAHQHGAVAGGQAIASPETSPSPTPESTPASVVAAPVTWTGGEGNGHGHGHGGGDGG